MTAIQFEVISPEDAIVATVYNMPVPRVGDMVFVSGYGRLSVLSVVWDIATDGFCDTVHVVCGAA